MTQSESVFVAMRGEKSEGGTILCGYSDKEDAEARVEDERQKGHFMSCDWASVEEYYVLASDYQGKHSSTPNFVGDDNE